MEVHHPHHPTHKKKWTEYILEFFMLFTAVTLGFFAENLRENIAEKHKKEELIIAVAADFRKDFNQIEFHKEFNENKIKICDSLDNLIKLDPKKIDQQLYYRLINNLYMSWKFNSNSRSRIEAEAKGYISEKENEELANYISKYTFHLTDLTELLAEEQASYEKFNENINRYVVDTLESKASRFPRLDIPHKLGIRPIEKADKENLKFMLIGVRTFNDIALYNIDSLQFYANKSIEFIERKYRKD